MGSARDEQDAGIARRRKMRAMCKGYNPLSIMAMSELETKKFSLRLARDAHETIRLRDSTTTARQMNLDEQEQYAGAIYAAILFFNQNSAVHRRLIAYREECQEAKMAMQRLREAARRERVEVIFM